MDKRTVLTIAGAGVVAYSLWHGFGAHWWQGVLAGLSVSAGVCLGARTADGGRG